MASTHRGSLSGVFRGALGFSTASTSPAPHDQTAGAPGGRHLNALNTVRTQAEALEKRAAFLEKKADDARAQAKVKFKAGDKTGASMWLKKETMFRKQAENALAQQFKLEAQALSLESLAGNAGTVNAMRAAKATQEQLLKNANSEEVSDLMMENQEMQDQADEIARMLGEPDPNDVLLEESIEAELAAMEAELAPARPVVKTKPAAAKSTAVRMPAAPSHPTELPQVPMHQPVIKKKVAVSVRDE